ncbi:MAG: HdaA/DnaA family protein [Wenzhouxiangella sp.]
MTGPNRVVVATLRDGLEPGGWYFLRGVPGSGRTHLLTAAFDECRRRSGSAMFLSLFDERHRGLLDHAEGDWLVVDDVDAVAGHGEGELALFNALNRWRGARSTVIMSGQGREAFELPDLRSRLGQAARLTLEPLDDAGLAELVRRLASEHEAALGRGVVEYMLKRAPRNAGRLAEVMKQCVRRAQAERRTISIPLVREVLKKCEG